MQIDIEDIRAADDRLEGVVRRTPILSSPFLDEIAGKRVLVKAECLQHTGSFKFRGGWSALTGMPPEAVGNGVLAYSSGNHAQGVARASALKGVPAVIVMPSDAPKLKISNTRALGAEVVLYDRESESREDIGDALARERGLTLVRPFDEPFVIAGQGTCGLEIANQSREQGVETGEILVPCGGGGLTSGVALAVAAEAPGLSVRPIEPEGFDDVLRSQAVGSRQSNNRATGSVCDAILTPSPGELTFPIIQKHCRTALSVTDDEAMRAVALAWQCLKIVVEPGGAVALAAALFHQSEVEGDNVICIATGGNVDPPLFAEILHRFA